MCGFTGFTNYIKDDGTVLGRMMDRIVHRGPDASGQFVDTDIALGFRRLSIIDLAEGGQPMFNEDKSLVLVFNGEIYNFKELRAELLEKGHIFANNSDSEVLLHGFEEWGESMVPRLRGMFAFVIFDRRDRSLFAARDMFGIKPFYYTFMGESFIFGSEIKSFLEHPDFKKELNEEALAHYLSFQYSPTEETFFKGVYKLPPAHYFTFKNGEMKKTRYFKPDFNAQDGVLEYFADLTDKAVRESVAAHKIADVEVGSFLSSGIDSSYIAEAANVDKTFTVGFESPDGDRYNEIHFAKKFADTIGVENISKIITPEEYWGTFPKIQYHMDEPLADPSAVISSHAELAEGTFVGKRAVINAGSSVGVCAILNTGSVIEHDCMVGGFVHVSPGAVLCGAVQAEANVHIGAGAVVMQGVRIGRDSIIGAGSVIIRDVPADCTVVGNPGRILERK